MSVAVWDFARVRACVRRCDEEEDTKGRVEECDPHYAASSYSPSHNVCLTGTCPGSSTLPGTWTSRPGNFFSARLYCQGTWTSRPGNFVGFICFIRAVLTIRNNLGEIS